MKKNILVVGCGITGLTTALHLLECGYSVHLVNDPRRRLTSEIAAAFWYPFESNASIEEEKSWALPTLDFYHRLINGNESGHGVRLVQTRQYFDAESKGNRPRPWWMTEKLPNCNVNFQQLTPTQLPKCNDEIGPFDLGWGFTIPVVDMKLFLKWLKNRIEELGGTFENRQVVSFDIERRNTKYIAVVNCTGIWATHLVEDSSLMALQGVVISTPIQKDEDRLLFLEHGKCMHKPIYIVPHKDRLVLGGTIDEVTRDGDAIPESDSSLWIPEKTTICQVIKRCSYLLPRLSDMLTDDIIGYLLNSGNAVAGLRPRRRGRAPRIEKDTTQHMPLIHNYGHGSSGITMCWGSAIAVKKLLQDST